MINNFVNSKTRIIFTKPIKTKRMQNLKNSHDIYQPVEVVNISKLTGLKMRDGLDNFIKVDGEVVKVASKDYGLITNQQFFGQFENLLDSAGIQYSRRAINNRNRNFAVDYILEDESFHVEIGSQLF